MAAQDTSPVIEPQRLPRLGEGSNQTDRFSAALDPLFARLDDRDIYDYLRFVFRLSEHIRYYGISDVTHTYESDSSADIAISGHVQNWQPFFSNGLIALAVVAREPIQTSLHDLTLGFSRLQYRSDALELLTLMDDLYGRLATWEALFPAGDAFRKVLAQVRLDRAFIALGEQTQKLRDQVDAEPGRNPEITQYRESFLAITGEMSRFYDGVVRTANESLAVRVEQHDHEPHIGLLLSFLELFEQQRDHLNQLGDRHLQFYFRDVLSMQPRGYQADTAYLTVELAKNTHIHQLDAGTEIKAGKDAHGSERVFTLAEDFVANRAKVAQVRSVFQSQNRVYAAADSRSLDGFSEPMPEQSPTWKPFRNQQFPLARQGVATSSPLLRLGSGERTVRLRFVLDVSFSDDVVVFGQDFAVSYSSPKGWAVANEVAAHIDGNIVELVIRLDMQADAVVDYSPELHVEADARFDDLFYRSDETAYPVIRCAWVTNSPTRHRAASALQKAGVVDWSIHVEVDNVQGLIVANDTGVLKPLKPFLPLGPVPRLGSQLYIGHPEVFAKTLDSVSLSWAWVDAPTNLNTHYRAYQLSRTGVNFTFEVAALTHQGWQPSANVFTFDSGNLFVNQFSVQQSDHYQGPFNDLLNHTPDDLTLPTFNDVSPTLPGGFLRFKLTGPSFGFGHSAYAALHQRAVINATKPVEPSDAEINALRAPYTPLWESLQLNYRASLHWLAEDINADRTGDRTSDRDGDRGSHQSSMRRHSVVDRDKSLMRLAALSAFGFRWQEPGQDPFFVLLSEPASLYLGIEDLLENQSVSLLFQFAEGTADPFISGKPDIHWEYLMPAAIDDSQKHGPADYAQWQPIDGVDIVLDTTEQFLQTGIVRLRISSVPTNGEYATDMPADLLWLRLTANNDPRLFNDLISVTAQATQARFENRNNSLEHLLTPLPSGTLTKLKQRNSRIKAIEQPLETQGGQGVEDSRHYYQRVSERLRHKDRAIQAWDYERLVLEQFPEVFKAHCLNHAGKAVRAAGDGIQQYNETRPGFVTLVVVPTLKNTHPKFRSTPAVKQATLRRIEAYLRQKTSPWVTLEVRNPSYEQVIVTGAVQFYDRITERAFYLEKLRAELDDFLTPWATDMARLSLGGRMYKSVILNFIEERDYVDYLKDFDVTINVNGQERRFEEELRTSSSLSLLVSSHQHRLSLC
ncbi:Uncharacterised protein [BD1-7 clade bacterium]|uniref:Uncharacterized protein n=1 Tax=BD1-7 clade bacterium TaxID=2029982 RepID=A0A5S9QP06_9GAMM|nr:Uncharacterised protein [BD1-7 clade bacterium]